MNRTGIVIASIAVLTVSSFAGSAQAKYLCNEPPTMRDARACEAAKEGPEALRRFIQRVRLIESMKMSDYVSKETVLAWEARRGEERDDQQAAK